MVDYEEVNPAYATLFNSYYDTIGPQYPRAERGVLSRPTVAEIYEYRQLIDQSMHLLLCSGHAKHSEILALVALGLHHEQQHQELMLTDIKHIFAQTHLSQSTKLTKILSLLTVVPSLTLSGYPLLEV